MLRRSQTAQKATPTTGLAPYTGPWDTPAVTHLLRRTMFGATQADIAYFKAKTMSQAVDELLTSAPAPTPPINDYNTATFTDPVVPSGSTWINAAFDFSNAPLQSARLDSLTRWWFQQMVQQSRTIDQKLILFWNNHFALEFSIVFFAQGLYRYYETLRQHALGNFKTMTRAITVDAAMLRYLNGYLNGKNAPDENYARELQELFTVGKGPDSQYTEEDVKAAAKVLTGFRINILNFGYYFDASQHHTGNKQFSSFYGNTTITGKAGAAGEQELDEMLDMIFDNTEVAKHICRRLYMFFVYYEIDATVETNVIAPLADVFRNSGYDIKATLSVLFKSEHFFDTLSRGCMIKNPIDFTVGMIREMDVAQPATLIAQHAHYKELTGALGSLGMLPGYPPNVSGWYAYYMAPMFHEIWINSDTLPKRLDVVQTLTSSGYTSAGFTTIIDGISFVSQLPDPEDPNALVADAVKYLYPFDISQSAKDYFKTFLLSGQTDDVYWSSAWLDYVANPTDPMARSTVQTRLQSLFKEMMSQAEYHLS